MSSNNRKGTVIRHLAMSSCSDIISDNKVALNPSFDQLVHECFLLVGSANQLKAFLNKWENAGIESDLAQEKIVRTFDPL